MSSIGISGALISRVLQLVKEQGELNLNDPLLLRPISGFRRLQHEGYIDIICCECSSIAIITTKGLKFLKEQDNT